MPHLSCIRIYPIKSLDPLELTQCEVLPSGALRNDRRFRVVDATGQLVNGKRAEAMHCIRCEYDSELTRVVVGLQDAAEREVFQLPEHLPSLAEWLSAALGYTVHIEENTESGFPDDTDASGPTLISRATLERVTEWFPQVDMEQVRRRMRANLELDGCEAFWEDQLFGAESPVLFELGRLPIWGTNPCARCVVPSRDAFTGRRVANFRETFAARRQEELPSWAPRERFNHFYRLAVNTRSRGPGVLRAGDQLIPRFGEAP